MASARGSSPTSEGGSPSSPQLSPKSRIQALVASLDQETDDEGDAASARARVSAALRKKTTASEPNPKTSNKLLKNQESTNEVSSDSEVEEDVVKPRGRLAAAMRAVNPESEDDVSTNKQTPHLGLERTSNKGASAELSEDADDAGSEESDMPVRSRKRKLKTRRSTTPIPNTQQGPTSPGLFVSPNAPKSTGSGNASDSDNLPDHPQKKNRFAQLVEKKKQEFEAREKAEQEKIAKMVAERSTHAEMLDEDDEIYDSDGNAGRRLTQQVRPTRKASKKALEDISRETQRLSRNMQLAHNAVTKKKFTVSDFMARFNGGSTKENDEVLARPTSSSSAPHSELDAKDTPPTSPLASGEKYAEDVPNDQQHTSYTKEKEGISSVNKSWTHIPSSPPMKLDKGKAIATEEFAKPKVSGVHAPKQRSIRVRPSTSTAQKMSPSGESDSDLEIVTAVTPKLKKKIESIFDRIPAKQVKEPSALHVLRTMAHLTSPGKQGPGKNKKPSITTSELQISLQQRARQQATREREERLQALRDKGIIVHTAEERQKEMAEVEDLISKARREGEEISKREKAAAKKERRERGEDEPVGDSSDDEDWEESKVIPEEHSASESEDEDIADSGSEEGNSSNEEEEEEEEMAIDDAQIHVSNPMFDNEAEESDEDEAEQDIALSADEAMIDNADAEEEDDVLVKQNNRRLRHNNVISDDEDDVLELDTIMKTPCVTKTLSPQQINKDSPVAPTSVLRSATKTFIPGVTVTGPVGLGLTQIFAGTMDESQSDLTPMHDEPQGSGSRQDAMSFLKRLPAPTLPPFMPTMEEDTQEFSADLQSQNSHIPESQPVELETQQLELNYSQSQIQGFDSLIDDESHMSPFPDATQDLGFQDMTPIKGRFVEAPPSTIDTVTLQPSAVIEMTVETPIAKKKGKLRRRAPVVSFSDDEAEDPSEPIDLEDDDSEIDENLFDIMRKASKKRPVVVDEFDKKKSKAKELVNEQAEESEDEYAGLGGASDDESGGEADEFVKDMIDDEGGKDVDERKLAAFFADRERASDEKQVEKLYKDITNGMLRRKRGADYDLSDSDDGGEARQRMKRKENAKLRKALLADERIGKIAENPKRQAFLRAIEDRGSDDEMDFLEDFAEQDEGSSQSQSQVETSQQVVPNSQATDMGPPPKRKRDEDSQGDTERLPPHLRRTKPAKKPANLSEIRESLSSLIEEPNAVIAHVDSGSESENELEIEGEDDLGPRKEKNKENRDPFTLRRTKHAVIDRISLKRASSSGLSNNTRLAFAASSSVPGFKVPALLRRATTNSSIVSATSSASGSTSTTERNAGGSGSDGVRRGGGKNSGINYFARENERRAAVVKTEKKREQKRFKRAEGRASIVGGIFSGGKFE